MNVSRVGCFGKIPAQGDFVRHHAEPFAFAGLDRWVQEGIAAQRGGLALRPARFLLFAKDAVLGGVLVPSRDRVGRQYPLAVFVVVAGGPQVAALAPAVLGGFFDAADAVADVATRGLDLAAVRMHVDSLRGVADEAAARTRVATFARATSVRAFGADVLGHEDVAGVQAWFGNVHAATGQAEVPRYVVRSLALDQPEWLCGWLGVVRAVAKHALQLVVWDRVGGPGLASCRMLFDGLHTRYANAVLHAQADGDLVFDVTPRTLGAPCPTPLEARIGDGSRSLADAFGVGGAA